MLFQIITLLLQVAFGLVVGACLLRLYMQYQRVALSARAGNPLGPFIFALTDWLVLPLRRVIPPMGRWDTASLVGAYLLALIEFALFWLMAGSHSGIGSIPIAAVFGLLDLVVSGMTGMVIVYAVLSWIQSDSPIAGIFVRLVAPWLKPIRRIVPLVGGFDLSPLVLLVLLQVAGIVLDTMRASVLA